MEHNVTPYPDPLASNEEKDKKQYGYQAAKVISNQWFTDDLIQKDSVYMQRRDWIRKMRQYSRGKQGLEYYRDLISRQDDDLNYLNLDWRPNNEAGKYVNLVANGMDEKYYRLNITAIDRLSADMKVDYRREREKEMYAQTLVKKAKEYFGVDMSDGGFVPQDQEDLDIHMSIAYKPKQEIAEELLIQYVFDVNKWNKIQRKVNKDLVECGLGVVEIYTDTIEGVRAEWVDIEDYIHSYNKNDNSFDNKYYDGKMRSITIDDLRKESDYTDAELFEIIKKYASKNGSANFKLRWNDFNIQNHLQWKVDVLDFTWKTTKRIAYKKKHNGKGNSKLAKKSSDYDIPKTPKSESLGKTLDTWYEGSWVLSAPTVYRWRESENIVGDKLNRAKSRFITVATDILDNELHSFLSDIIPMVDQIHITKLKLQHIIAEIKPKGAEIDWDMLANLSGGDKIDYKEILALFAAKNIVFKKRIADEFGGVKEGRAVEEIPGGVPANLLDLLQILASQKQELRDITGINPSRDGTQPHDALVGIQQAQIVASNTITQHIAEAAKDLKCESAEVISARIADIFRFPEAKDLKKIYEKAIGKLNVDILEDIGTVHLHEYGFKLELLPSQEEMLKFEEMMKIALQAGKIDEDDMMEAREIAKVNPKYANQFLKMRKKKRMEEEMKRRAQEAQIKSQNDIASNNAASQNRNREKEFEGYVEVQKATKLAQIEVQKQHMLNQINAPLRKEDAALDVYLKKLETLGTFNLNKYKEDKKDERQNKNNTDHSKMIAQRKYDTPPIDFTQDNELRKLLNQTP